MKERTGTINEHKRVEKRGTGIAMLPDLIRVSKDGEGM